MKEKIQNKKVIYIVIAIIILAGIFATYMWKTNVSLVYTNHTRIDVYIGKDYNIEDVKEMSKEVFGEQEIVYQEIETFHDSVAIHVKEASEEQVEDLKTKLVQKYEIEDDSNLIQTIELGNVRIRDMVMPYIIPMIIATLMILAYVGIRYLNLGIFKVIFTLFFSLLISQALLFSVFEIVRIPVNIYTIPVALALYILVTIMSVAKYEKQLTLEKLKDEKKK